MVTKKQLLGLAIRVADKKLKANSLELELLDMFAQFLGYDTASDYEDETGNEFWSDWFIDKIQMGSLTITDEDIDIVIEQLKEIKQKIE